MNIIRTPIVEKRMAIANAALVEIGSVGRRFFWSAQYQRFAEFRISDDRKPCLTLVDDYSGKPVKVIPGKEWPHFSHGGTLRSLIEDMAIFITIGEPVPLGHFGPWTHCGDLWGIQYRDAMPALRERMIEMGICAAESEVAP